MKESSRRSSRYRIYSKKKMGLVYATINLGETYIVSETNYNIRLTVARKKEPYTLWILQEDIYEK